MLSRDTPHLSPFITEGLSQPTRQQQQSEPIVPPERNRGRGFRRSGNACEVAAGASLNSAIIFLFHLLQVHPLGLLVALGCSHFYFVATAFGEGHDRLIGNAMTGASAGVAGLSALSEPIGEWLEAKQSQDAATQQIQELYSPQTPVINGSAVLILLAITSVVLMAISMQGKSRTRR
ncbi:MAG: hypothetical protein KME15_26950 [Drouetiella hepatica Uher 2000/2452]|jgi:hypothetical protein|uniref:Uncharacterized protein n=1 Tax=Drouetiella hepatica Uher 2000/2452 TaxID=904376 RepID=A0A951QGP8_9CYAN|nr:hypothetical protein [Drouetiella hepatica Uher 2000/2452]